MEDGEAEREAAAAATGDVNVASSAGQNHHGRRPSAPPVNGRRRPWIGLVQSPLVLDDRSIDDRRLYGVGVMRPESSPVEPRSASDIAAELRVRCVSGGGTARAPGVCGSGIAQSVARNYLPRRG